MWELKGAANRPALTHTHTLPLLTVYTQPSLKGKLDFNYVVSVDMANSYIQGFMDARYF